MKPVTQTIEGYPDGNCTEACVASILEIPLDAVLVIKARDYRWLDELNAWLAHFNLSALPIKAGEGFIPSGWHLIGGKSPRGDFGHYVVGFNGKVKHDPHPSGDGIETETDYLLFVSMRPELHV